MLSTNVSRCCKAMGEIGHVVVIESSQVDGVDAFFTERPCEHVEWSE